MKSATDYLFVFQIVLAFSFGVPQAIKMLESVQGMTIVLFVCFELFVLFNLFLAHQAHKEVPSRGTIQALIIYYLWFIVVTVHLIILTSFGKWTRTDSIVMLTLVTLSIIGIIWQRFKGRGLSDPMTRGYLALCAKSVPQFYLAYCIFKDGGGNGLSAWTVWCGHITVLIRIAMLIISGRKSGWNKNIIGSIVSEVGNQLSWSMVTVLWLIM